MTPNLIISLAQKRVKNSSDNVLWNDIFGIVMNDIFTDNPGFKFARGEFNYIHSQSTFEKIFDDDAVQLALNKIINIRYTTSYTLFGGIPIPTANSTNPLIFKPLQEFREDFPDEQLDGTPEWWTEVDPGDGSTGMQIGIFRRPTVDAAVWVDGYFIPTYVIGATELPFLPKQFHSMVIDGIAGYAAEELGMAALSTTNFKRFQYKLAKLKLWDSHNPSHKMKIGARGGSGKLRLYLPGDFPLGVGR